MALIYLIVPSIVTPKRYANTCIFKSEIQTNFFNKFLGIMYVNPDYFISYELVHTLFVLINMLVAESALNLQSV